MIDLSGSRTLAFKVSIYFEGLTISYMNELAINKER